MCVMQFVTSRRDSERGTRAHPVSGARVTDEQLPPIAACVEPFKFKPSDGGGLIEGGLPVAAQCEVAMAVLRAEMRRYPVGFFEHIGLRKIVLCSNLKEEEQRRAFAIEFKTGEVFCDADTAVRWHWGFHHEVFHLLSRKGKFLERSHAAWKTINPRPPEVRAEPFPIDNANYASLGYVSFYAKTNINEDMAETYASMVSDGENLSVRIRQDDMLRRKVALIHKLVTAEAPEVARTLFTRVQIPRQPTVTREN